MSYRPEVLVDGEWSSNGQRFATLDEAAESASSLYGRWMQAAGHRAMPSDDPVNYRRVEHRDERIEVGQS